MLSTSNIIEIGVSVPNVRVLKRNYFGNTIAFYYYAESDTTIILHATINIDAQVSITAEKDYLQAIRVK